MIPTKACIIATSELSGASQTDHCQEAERISAAGSSSSRAPNNMLTNSDLSLLVPLIVIILLYTTAPAGRRRTSETIPPTRLPRTSSSASKTSRSTLLRPVPKASLPMVSLWMASPSASSAWPAMMSSIHAPIEPQRSAPTRLASSTAITTLPSFHAMTRGGTSTQSRARRPANISPRSGSRPSWGTPTITPKMISELLKDCYTSHR